MLKHSVKLCRWCGSVSAIVDTLLYNTSCKHSLVLLRMGEIIARNMLSWLKLLIKWLLLQLGGCFYYCIDDALSHEQKTHKINKLFLLISQYSQAKGILYVRKMYVGRKTKNTAQKKKAEDEWVLA